MAVKDAISVQGLDEFRRSLKKLDSDLPKMLRVAFNEAADIVVADARPRYPYMTGVAASTLAARSSQREVRIQEGGRKAPYVPWLDFGGTRGGRGGGQAKRPFLKDGRFIYRSYTENREKFTEVLVQSLIKVAGEAGLEVTP